MDARDDYAYGWSAKGEPITGSKSGRRQELINMIAGYKDGEIIAPFTIAGACNRKVFETWIEFCLIPALVVGDILIIDNATFHHGGRVTELVEAAGCKVIYLPPYSPHFNRIEKCWAWLKARIRKLLRDGISLHDAMDAVLAEVAS